MDYEERRRKGLLVWINKQWPGNGLKWNAELLDDLRENWNYSIHWTELVVFVFAVYNRVYNETLA